MPSGIIARLNETMATADLITLMRQIGMVQGKFYGIGSLMVIRELYLANSESTFRSRMAQLLKKISPQADIGRQTAGGLPYLRSMILRKANARARHRLVFPAYIVEGGQLLS